MRSLKRLPYLVRLFGIATIVSFSVVICGALLIRLSFTNPSVQATTYPTPSSTITPKLDSIPTAIPNTAITINPTPIAVEKLSPLKQQPITTRLEYGHFRYAQADQNQMMIVGSYASGVEQRFEYLNPEASQAFMKMIYTAREAGIWIIPVSGFRSIEQQEKLFKNQIKRHGSAKEAAKISAPPGYSEHHTGFAVDLTDGRFPQQDINLAFENTDAYRWLTRHAQEFGFEMSFTPNNPQGVSFEPWHWRYVGSQNSAAVFANARNK